MNSETPNPFAQRNLELRMVIGVLTVVLFLLGAHLQKKADENAALRSSLTLVEASLEQQQENNQQQFDSLQLLIQQQDQYQLQLKDTLALLESRRQHLNTRLDENKAAIAGIGNVDSLRNVVAGRYR